MLKVKVRRFFTLLVCVLTLSVSCGIDDYAYLEPVSSISPATSDSLRIRVTLPTDSNQTIYFDEYLIYYRIYLTNVFGTENPLINQNYEKIVSTNANYPTTIESVLKSLSFRILSYGTDSMEATITPTENPLKKANNIGGQYFFVEFNLASMGRNYPTLIKEDSSIYRLLRNGEIDFGVPQDQDLVFHQSFALGSGNPDVAVSGTDSQKAHVALYIVASGRDFNQQVIHSTAQRIGVFLLDAL